ncbi:hypothetical protein JTB14_001836 [Gonioctena quinquepunctata]|nr:hypothetical protein JTB14_001836 [Gonioctena quinquepunctata]
MREKRYSAVIKGFNLVMNGETFSLEGLQELKSIGNTQNQEDEVLNEAESSTNRKKEDKRKRETGNKQKSFYAAHLAETKISTRNTRKSLNAAHLDGARAYEAGFHPITLRRHDIKENNEERKQRRKKPSTKKETTKEERNQQRKRS